MVCVIRLRTPAGPCPYRPALESDFAALGAYVFPIPFYTSVWSFSPSHFSLLPSLNFHWLPPTQACDPSYPPLWTEDLSCPAQLLSCRNVSHTGLSHSVWPCSAPLVSDFYCPVMVLAFLLTLCPTWNAEHVLFPNLVVLLRYERLWVFQRGVTKSWSSE